MKITIKATLVAIAVCCLSISTASHSGEALDAVNVEVEQQAELLDQKFGLLLTNTERQNLRIGLITNRVIAAKAEQPEKNVEALVDEAIATFEITDPIEQRQLLIEVEAQVAGGGGGVKPQPCCG